METETAASPAASKRPRPLLLILLGVVGVAFLLMRLGGSTGSAPPAPGRSRAPQPAGADAKIDPAALDVQLEALEGERPGPGDTERNPFRFQPKAPPPQAAPPPTGPKQRVDPDPEVEQTLPPPLPPPITVKYIGTIQLPDGITIAVFTDCTVGRKTRHYREGDVIFGQYRLVKIGVTSVVVEHLDGRGRTTLPKGGQECVK